MFVSYSREGGEHESWVLRLAQLLRHNGVDATLDKWDLKPGADMAHFMESQIRDSDFVILVCTPTYAQKSNIPSGGVGYEKNIISAEMLQSRDLRPKFIPVLRDGDFDSAIPTYLGSKSGIDFRRSRKEEEALGELLRAIYEVPPPSKPALGPNPFTEGKDLAPSAGPTGAAGRAAVPVNAPGDMLVVSGQIEPWEQRALGRFDFLRQTRIRKENGDPFAAGYWQASFALQGLVRDVSLPILLEILRKSKTNRTGWDIGWVPTRESIAPYPFQDGIEVWLAEEGGKGPAHSDFWRAEKIGTFSLFRGYQEDETDFAKSYPGIGVDYSLVLWRISEFLLYLENFAGHLGAGPLAANVRIRWTGLENRRLGSHKDMVGLGTLRKQVCRQASVESVLHIDNTTVIRKTLIRDIQAITRPLFEAFHFFSLNEEEVKGLVRGLFDATKESI